MSNNWGGSRPNSGRKKEGDSGGYLYRRWIYPEFTKLLDQYINYLKKQREINKKENLK